MPEDLGTQIALLKARLEAAERERDKLDKKLDIALLRLDAMERERSRWLGIGTGVLAVGAVFAWFLAGASDLTETVKGWKDGGGGGAQ